MKNKKQVAGRFKNMRQIEHLYVHFPDFNYNIDNRNIIINRLNPLPRLSLILSSNHFILNLFVKASTKHWPTTNSLITFFS